MKYSMDNFAVIMSVIQAFVKEGKTFEQFIEQLVNEYKLTFINNNTYEMYRKEFENQRNFQDNKGAKYGKIS